MARRGDCWVCDTVSGTAQENWQTIYGTSAYGNLPQHKVTDHIGHSWNPCPYSTQCPEDRARILFGITSVTGTLPARADHTSDGTVHYLRTSGRGARWGYECLFDGCTYYTDTGNRYFRT